MGSFLGSFWGVRCCVAKVLSRNLIVFARNRCALSYLSSVSFVSSLSHQDSVFADFTHLTDFTGLTDLTCFTDCTDYAHFTNFTHLRCIALEQIMSKNPISNQLNCLQMVAWPGYLVFSGTSNSTVPSVKWSQGIRN